MYILVNQVCHTSYVPVPSRRLILAFCTTPQITFIDSLPSRVFFCLLEVFPYLIFASRLYYCTVLYFVVGLEIIGSHAGTQTCMMKKCGHLTASLTMMQASFKNTLSRAEVRRASAHG